MYKHIKYRATLSGRMDTVAVVILEQTHRFEKFGDGEHSKFSYKHKGFTIESCSCPELSHEYCFLRGDNSDKDYSELVMDLDTYAKFKATVLSYNEYFSN